MFASAYLADIERREAEIENLQQKIEIDLNEETQKLLENYRKCLIVEIDNMSTKVYERTKCLLNDITVWCNGVE